MSEWKEIEIGEVVETNKLNVNREYPHSEILYLDTGSITCNRIDGLQKFELSSAPSRAKRLVKDLDIIYSSVRPNQLHYGIIRNPENNLVVSTGFVVITCNQDKIAPYFLYYYLSQISTTEFLHSIAEGSTSAYPSLKPSDIEALEILLPPLDEQNAIASVLSSLDDKIDLLHRQNKTLEQMAETLFRQWFVEEADEGWEEKSLSDYFLLPGGFAFKSKEYVDVGKYKVITIKGVQDGYLDSNSAARLDILPEKIKSYQILNTGDILMSLTGNVGRVCLVDEENCLLNQRVAKIEPINKKWKAFAYFYFRQNEMIERLTYLSKGSAQLNLSPVETLAKTEQFPDDASIDNYCEIVNSFLSKILKNKTQIHTLTALRDTLLPKLMSGEVRIEIE